ncbi:MAG: T9SS type A sorting domain-containing protein [Taibaiella sp.]|nr:T9SS type A sorting domain-containing protein [Taibaiella sp.]
MFFTLNTGVSWSQVILSEDFSGLSGSTPPADWSNTAASGTTYLWEFDNPGERSITGGDPGFDEDFAIFDSDNYPEAYGDASLETPTFDASGDGSIILEYDNQIRYVTPQTNDVDVWNGEEWVNVYNSTTSDGYTTANHKMIDITEAAGGYTEAKVRFRFTGNWRWWWAIDNVVIERVMCTEPTDLSVDDITASGAEVTWSGTGTYILEYGLEGFTPGTGSTAGTGGTIVDPATSPYEISGLSSSTDYDVYLRTDCEETYSENVLISFTTAAPPPDNDDCENAIEASVGTDMTCSMVTSGTTEGATLSEDVTAPGCGTASGLNDDVWFYFEATSTSHLISVMNVTAVVGSSTDIVSAVYSGTCGDLVAEACSDPNNYTVEGLTIGETYYVRVWTYGTTSQVDFDLCISPIENPENDNCEDAIEAPVNTDLTCSVITSGTTVGATLSEGVTAPGCGTSSGLDDDVWFYFEATSTAHYISVMNVTAVVGSSTDIVSAVYSGTCGDLVAEACSDPNSYTVDGLTIGETYYVRVWTYGTTSQVDFDLCISPLSTEAPENDDCEGAIAFPDILTDGTCASVIASTSSATSSGISACTGSGADDDIWYSFVCPTGHTELIYSITSVLGNTDRVIEFFEGDGCGDLTSIECFDPESGWLTDLTPGGTYYFRVHTYGTDSWTSVNICLKTIPTGATCENPLEITSIPYAHTSNTAEYGDNPNIEGSAGSSCGSSSSYLNGDDVVYEFTSPITGNIDIELTGITNTYAGIFVYSSCDDIGVSCLDGGVNGSSTADIILEDFAVTAGSTYYIVISTWASPQSTDYTLSIIPPPPCDGDITFEEDEPSVCEDQSATLEAISSVSTEIIKWYASETAIFPLHTGSIFTTPTLTTTTTYYVEASNEDCISDRVAITVTVHPFPDVAAEDDEVIICAGNTAVLNATSSNEEATFAWYGTETSTEVLSSSASFTTPSLTTSTSYFVAANFNGCLSDRIEVEVTVNPTPVVTATPEDEELCLFGSTTITATSSLSGTTFEWFASATGTEPLETGSTFETPIIFATTSYFVEGTSSDGCISEREEIAIIVNNPEITAENAYYICDPHSVTLTAEAAEGATIGWYESSSAEEPIATGSSFTTPVISETTTYYVASTENGCRSYMDAVTVYREAYDIEIEEFAFCPNEEYLAIPLSFATTPETTIYWYSDEELTDLVHTGESYIAPTPESTTTYYVTAEGENCTTDPREVTITVYPLPSVSIEPENELVCSGEFVTFVATPLDEQTYEYIWTPTGTEGATLTTDEPGTHTVLITSVDYGCSITQTVELDTVPAPYVAGFDYYPEIFTNPLLYVFAPTDTANLLGYSWDFGDGHTSEEFEVHHEYAEFGTYTVTFHFYNECDTNSISLEIYVHPSTSIDHSKLNNHVDVYPNPTNQDLNISITDGNQITKVSVYNHLGQLMLHEMVNNESKYSFSVAPLAQGTYYILIDTRTGQQAIKKFVVQH